MKIMATYSLRSKERKNYREIADIRLPRPKRLQAINKLYLVEVLQRENGRVKTHYVGYSDINDEWHDEEEITPFGDSEYSSIGFKHLPRPWGCGDVVAFSSQSLGFFRRFCLAVQLLFPLKHSFLLSDELEAQAHLIYCR